MRRLFLLLVACVPGFADTLSTSVTCNGVTYNGTASASCTDSDASASASSGNQMVGVFVLTDPGGSSQASASLSGVYELTVFGGSGDGFAAPELSASSGFDGAGADSQAQESLMNSSGAGCYATSLEGGMLETNCTSTSLPFVFGVPETLTLSMNASAFSLGFYESYPITGGAGGVGFAFYDVNGNPLPATYTFVPASSTAPTPEPGMFPLLAAMACAALIARRRLRKSFPGR
jgi:hypothetical protein